MTSLPNLHYTHCNLVKMTWCFTHFFGLFSLHFTYFSLLHLRNFDLFRLTFIDFPIVTTIDCSSLFNTTKFSIFVTTSGILHCTVYTFPPVIDLKTDLRTFALYTIFYCYDYRFWSKSVYTLLTVSLSPQFFTLYLHFSLVTTSIGVHLTFDLHLSLDSLILHLHFYLDTTTSLYIYIFPLCPSYFTFTLLPCHDCLTLHLYFSLVTTA